ncbi:MAG: pyrroline-5-carboxylate reductase [Pseudomonadota bacterium]
MELSDVNSNGLTLLGCGKMGSAMLDGWLKAGVKATSICVLDPNPSDWLMTQARLGVAVNEGAQTAPAVVLIAVKPQMMDEALPYIQSLSDANTVFLSIAAGTPILRFEDILGADKAVIRAMPNTPAAIGKGITALIGNANVSEHQMRLAEGLLAAIGRTVRLQDEGQMDAVTAVSGSGPAYVFHLIETLGVAAMAEGLPQELAHQLALATVEGAGALAAQSTEMPSQLRVNVTSPNGTTQAGLDILMDDDAGLGPLIGRTVRAAAKRSKELGNE